MNLFLYTQGSISKICITGQMSEQLFLVHCSCTGQEIYPFLVIHVWLMSTSVFVKNCWYFDISFARGELCWSKAVACVRGFLAALQPLQGVLEVALEVPRSLAQPGLRPSCSGLALAREHVSRTRSNIQMYDCCSCAKAQCRCVRLVKGNILPVRILNVTWLSFAVLRCQTLTLRFCIVVFCLFHLHSDAVLLWPLRKMS